MAFLESVWWLLVLIGVMILIHELGHYWAARFFDVRIETFSFGFGPRLFGFRRGETDFRFSLILFGGYVKMAGEQPGEENTDDPRGFLSKPRWQRLIIAFAGPFMNIILAIALLTGLFMQRFPKLPAVKSPVIGHVAPDSAASKAGLHAGDRIVQIENVKNPTWEDVIMKEIVSASRPLTVFVERPGGTSKVMLTPTLDDKNGVGMAGWEGETEIQVGRMLPGMDAEKAGLRKGDLLISVNGEPIRSRFTLHDVMAKNQGKPVEMVYSRDGQQSKVTVQPTFSNMDGESRWMIGVQLEPRMLITRLSFPDALVESVRENAKYSTLILQFLRGMIERRMSPKALQGPIGIAQMSRDAAKEGPMAFFGLMSMVSMNLAIFNLLPIPILDGGVILMLLVEILMGRDINMRVKETVFKVGFVFLMAVVVFVLYNDITKILPAG